MGRFLLIVGLGIWLTGSILTGVAGGQTRAPENVVSPTATTSSFSPSNDAVQPVGDSSESTLDPASLLPDLPSLPRTNASLVGGTIEKLDRVRAQIMVHTFGGGSMRIAFDPRTHIYHDGVLASASDLRQGDRVYVDTILDGNTVFARSIRLRTTTVAGEGQGIVTSFRSDTGELLIRDSLSPRPLRVRLTPQTQFMDHGHAASASELVTGTLVAVKFGPQQDGTDVAREVSVLAVPGASFTFVGLVTAVDLRLGLLALTSPADHKNYEIYLDPSVVAVDDNLRPGVDVTVLSRFDGSRYVARSVAINSKDPR